MVQYRPMTTLPDGTNFSRILSQPFFDYYWFFQASAVLYLVALYYGQRFMKTRKPVQNLKWVMFVWNMLLSAISAVMLYRCFATGYISYLITFPWREAICMNRHVGIDYGMSWTYAWMGYTKVMELLDTVFLVVRKKHVMTLHWFHHATVLVFVANAHVFGKTNVYVPFTIMNSFVHVLMYFYFAMASIRIFFPFPHLLTALQILQMVVGCFVVWNGQYCPEHPMMFYGGLIMYASYFLLFAKFFWDKYSGGKDVKME